jgi:tetratricopeptide (TPR) repeat protein
MTAESGKDLSASLAAWRALLERNDLAGLAANRPALEAVKPTDEASWALMRDVFTALSRPVWAEIMTARFLSAEPSNLAALLEQVLQISRAPMRQDEAIQKAEELVNLPFDRADHFLALGSIFSYCGLPGRAAIWFKRARDAEPDNVHIRVNVIHAFHQMRDPAQARAELASLRSIANQRIGVLLAVSRMASDFNDMPLALETFKTAEALLGADRHEDRALYIAQAARIGQFEAIGRAVSMTDFSKIQNFMLLDECFHAVEGRGLHAAERQIAERALAVAPGDTRFQERVRRLAGPRPAFFADTAPETAPPVRAIKDRLRDLMFWR